MVYESSYESGMKPFRPDAARGHWTSPADFIYACWGLAFKMDIFSMAWYFYFEMGIYTFIPHLICLATYVVPIILIQSFLGQFSSSGFISAFRLAPIFKGIGYISLALNFSVLTYYSIFAAIPLIYFFNSLRPTLPWSCAAFQHWSPVLGEGERTICTNGTAGLSPVLIHASNSSGDNSTWTELGYHSYQIPSVMFFRSLFDYQFEFREDLTDALKFSWEMLLTMLLVWAAVAFIFYKCSTVEQMGRLIRHTIWLLMGLMLVCVARLVFLTDAREALREYFLPHPSQIFISLYGIPIAAISSFGIGWGAFISLASYNKFRTDISRFSWYISLGQLLIMVLFGLANFLIDRHFVVITNQSYYANMEEHWILYLSSGSAMAEMELANMWSMLFFTMLFLSGLLTIFTQLFAMLTAIFDDFEYLRARRQEVTLALIGLLAVFSIYFCSNHGLTYFMALPADAMFTQTALNLLLLLVVLWVYGRVRFQRDIEFMLGTRFATWRVYVLRFIAPLCLILTLLAGLVIAYYEHYLSSAFVAVVAVFLIGIPWLFVPGYAVLRMLQTSGKFGLRFKRCCRPTDWYPVDPEERQRYEEAMGNLDITHQLNVVPDEEEEEEA